MPLYVITCLDKPDSLDLRMATRPAHLDYLAANGEGVRLGGPLLDDHDQMIGSQFVVEFDDKAQAAAFTADDPYGKAGLFECVVIRPWCIVKGAIA